MYINRDQKQKQSTRITGKINKLSETDGDGR